MKRIVFAIGFMLLPLMVSSQSFELTVNGFVNADDHTKNYIIVPFEGKSKEEIFSLASRAIGKVYNSAKDIMSPVPNEQISVHGFIPEVTTRSVLGIPHYFNMDYKIVFEFKDGKMKINAPSIIQIIHYFGTEVFYLSKRDVASKSLKYHLLFKEDGQVKEKKHKENIETKTNNIVTAILHEMQESDW